MFGKTKFFTQSLDDTFGDVVFPDFVITPSLLGDIEGPRHVRRLIELAQGGQLVCIYFNCTLSHMHENLSQKIMISQSQIYPKNNPRVTDYFVNYGFTDKMAITLSEFIKARLIELGIKPAELARRAGMTKQNVGRILNETPHPVTKALPKVEEETVRKLATGLSVDEDIVRVVAGYAAKDPPIGKKLYPVGKGVSIQLDTDRYKTEEERLNLIKYLEALVLGQEVQRENEEITIEREDYDQTEEAETTENVGPFSNGRLVGIGYRNHDDD